MSGIYGLFQRDGAPADSEALERLAASMSRWGPDGEGRWSDGTVVLGHLMRFITPQSLSEQLPATRRAAQIAANRRRVYHDMECIAGLEAFLERAVHEALAARPALMPHSRV